MPSWAQDPAARRTKKIPSEEGPRDVESMKKEIAEVQTETTQSLDRAIAAAQAATCVGGDVAEELVQQREQVNTCMVLFRAIELGFIVIPQCTVYVG